MEIAGTFEYEGQRWSRLFCVLGAQLWMSDHCNSRRERFSGFVDISGRHLPKGGGDLNRCYDWADKREAVAIIARVIKKPVAVYQRSISALPSFSIPVIGAIFVDKCRRGGRFVTTLVWRLLPRDEKICLGKTFRELDYAKVRFMSRASIGKRRVIRARALFGFIFPLVSFIFGPAYGASWIVNLDRHGLPELSVGGASAISSNFVFWGPNAAWTFFPNQRQGDRSL